MHIMNDELRDVLMHPYNMLAAALLQAAIYMGVCVKLCSLFSITNVLDLQWEWSKL